MPGEGPTGWSGTTLGELFSWSSGKKPPFTIEPEGPIPVFGSNGILGFGPDANVACVYLVGRVGASGSLHTVRAAAWANDNTLVAEPSDGRADFDFLGFLLDAANLSSLATKTAQPLLTQSNLKPIRVAIPPLPEQKKIAAILSSVDEAIQATQAVIDQTRRVKEGLLQDLLTRGIGHTRFKHTEIGEIPEAWEVRRLGDVVEPLFDDCTLEPDVAYFPAIVRRRHRGVDFPESRLGAEILVKDQYRVHPGTVLFSKRQLVHGATGLIGPTVPATAIMSKEYYQLRGGRGLSTQFLSYWTRTSAFQNIAERCTYGVDREKFVVNERWFFSSPTPVPPLDEQAAIVTSLDGLDSVVSENNGRLSALQSVKSGLLTDLLTGKVRVTP